MGMIFYSSEEPNSYIIKSISMYTLEYLIFNYTVFKNNARYSTASTTLWCPYHQDTLYILNVDIAQRQASRATQRRTCSSRLSTSLASSPSVCLSTIRYPRLPVIVEEQRSFSQFDAPPPCVRQWRCSGCAKVGNYTIAWKNRRNITKISHRAWPSLTLPLDSSVMDERLKEIDVRMRGTRLYVRITCYRLSFHLSCCAKERTYSTIIFGLMTFDDHKRNSDSAAREQDLSCDFFTMRKIFFARIRSPVDFLLAPIFLSLILRVTLRKSRVEHETCPRRTRAFYVRRSNIARISIFFFFFSRKNEAFIETISFCLFVRYYFVRWQQITQKNSTWRNWSFARSPMHVIYTWSITKFHREGLTRFLFLVLKRNVVSKHRLYLQRVMDAFVRQFYKNEPDSESSFYWKQS